MCVMSICYCVYLVLLVITLRVVTYTLTNLSFVCGCAAAAAACAVCLQKKRVVVMDLRNDYEWDAGRLQQPAHTTALTAQQPQSALYSFSLKSLLSVKCV